VSNITLQKFDGKPLTLPTGSIRAIISLAIAPKREGQEDALSVLVSDFRGYSAFLMAHPAKDIAEQLEALANAKKGALRLGNPAKKWATFSAGDDRTFLEPDAVIASEGVSYALTEGGEKVDRLRLHWRRPDGQVGNDDVELTPENLAAAGAV
jgi:hypothetical protein